MKENIEKVIISSLVVFLFTLAIFGGTYAYFKSGTDATGNNIAGDSIAIDASVSVDTIRSGNLVPTADSLVMTSLNGSYPCEDSRGYSLCSLYQITLTNSGPAVTLNAKITLNNATNYTTNHLKYQMLTKAGNTYTSVSDASVIDIVGNSDNYIRNNEVKVDFTLNRSASSTYYLVIWLSDIGDNQLEDANKTLSANIVFEAQDGGAVTAFLVPAITVTFDPDGGTVSPQTKQVSYGHSYGLLPKPTKTGYVFKGWNGKNLINIDNKHVVISNNYYKDYGSVQPYTLSPNTVYTFSFDYVVNSATKNVFASVGYGTTYFGNDIKSSPTYSGTGTVVINFTTADTFTITPANFFTRPVRMSSAGDANVDVSNFQLVKGNTATAYEPYYITSDTKVVQDGNHTLKAIWEAE